MSGPWIYDRVKDTTTTTGTGTVTLANSAPSGYRTFGSVLSNNDTVYYCIALGSEWEVGIGTYTTSGTTLARTTVLASSNSNAAVSFSAGTKDVFITAPGGPLNDAVQFPHACEGRLTLTSGLAVTTADVTGATSIYFTPFLGNRVSLYDGTRWRMYSFAELTLALGTLTSGKNYDVFLYDNAGTLTLESLVWTNDTTRATALVLQDGVYSKTGALTRRYLGTFRTTSTTQTEDSLVKRFLWNMYNRESRILTRIDTTASWTYASTTVRQANGSASNQVEVVIGVAGVTVNLTVQAVSANSTGGSLHSIGIDRTNGYDGTFIYRSFGASTFTPPAMSSLKHKPAEGYHFYAWVEAASTTGTMTTYSGSGDDRSGMLGDMMA